jgi:hypothetical protein
MNKTKKKKNLMGRGLAGCRMHVGSPSNEVTLGGA